MLAGGRGWGDSSLRRALLRIGRMWNGIRSIRLLSTGHEPLSSGCIHIIYRWYGRNRISSWLECRPGKRLGSLCQCIVMNRHARLAQSTRYRQHVSRGDTAIAVCYLQKYPTSNEFSQQLLNRSLQCLRIGNAGVSFHNVPLPVQQEFLKVPLDPVYQGVRYHLPD